METLDAGRTGAALITGASRGIGRATALRLARSGFDIAVNYVRSEGEAESVAEAVRQTGVSAITLQADMADTRQAANLVQRAEAALGPLQAVVSNAGITRDRLLIQMSEDDWAATWDTDLSGPRALCLEALLRMSERLTGRIVTVGSVVGSLGNAGQVNYASAK